MQGDGYIMKEECVICMGRSTMLWSAAPAAVRGIHFFPSMQTLILLSSTFKSVWKNRKLHAAIQRKIISVSENAAHLQG